MENFTLKIENSQLVENLFAEKISCNLFKFDNLEQDWYETVICSYIE